MDAIAFFKRGVLVSLFIFTFIFISPALALESSDDFYSYYTKIESGQEFEGYSRTSEFADIVVNIGRAEGKLVFWRGSSYLPYWQTEKGKWFLEEEIPRKGDGPKQRPDNVNTYSQVEIIESNSARIIIRWRYVTEFDNSYDISVSDWAVEYFTVYLDGTLFRMVRKPSESLEKWETPENMVQSKLSLHQNGTKTLSQAETEHSLTIEADNYLKKGFDKATGANVIELRTHGKPEKLALTFESEAENPVIEIQNWGQAPIGSIQVESEPFTDFQVGYEHSFDLTNLVIWFDSQFKKGDEIVIIPGQYEQPTNKPPTVSAGDDKSLLVEPDSSGPYNFTLEGFFLDDGLPGDTVTFKWEKISGPGDVKIKDENTLITNVDIESERLYIFRLTVSDGELESSDEVNVVIDREPGKYGSPIAWWGFEETEGNLALDKVSGKKDAIEGNFSRQVGVVGNAIRFSEYDTLIKREASKAPQINTKAFTIEAWVAPRSYPWNWCPIVTQKTAEKGFFFGMDTNSRFGLWVATSSGWQKCNTSKPFSDGEERGAMMERIREDELNSLTLPLLKWSHVVGTFDSGKGIKLYLDGEPVGEMEFEGELAGAAGELYMGRDTEKLKPWNSTRVTPKINYSFDGLMDEIKIYNSALTSTQVAEAYNHAQPKIAQPLEFKQVPLGPAGPGKRFGITHTLLDLEDDFERRFRFGEDADKVLVFDDYDFKIVWWHGIAYYPVQYASNGIGMQHEAVETRGENGCEEALMDKQCRYARVKVIENTPARVMVEFRSCSNDLYYNITHQQPDGWGCWTDDLWTIYPDATVGRRVTLWCTEQHLWHSYEQENYVIPVGMRQVDILEKEANTVVNLDGDVSSLNWETGWPEGKHIALGAAKTYNIQANAWPFIIGIVGLQDLCNADNTDTCLEGPRRQYPYCFPWWDHWPIEQIPSDGRSLYMVNGHFSSTCTGAIIMDTYLPIEQKEHRLIEGTENSITVPFMFGMTPREATSKETVLKLLPLARMYNNPPIMSDSSECILGGYSRYKHEYKVIKKEDNFSFRLLGSERSPIVNPCFVVKNWGSNKKADLSINGRAMPAGKQLRQGVVRDTMGNRDLVIWIEYKSEEPTEFSIMPDDG
ncbi:MAG: LamG domain-containing protein [Planctomycetota bacterium]|jgi:hypothetical protein